MLQCVCSDPTEFSSSVAQKGVGKQKKGRTSYCRVRVEFVGTFYAAYAARAFFCHKSSHLWFNHLVRKASV